MTEIEIKENVSEILEKTIKPQGNGAMAQLPKRLIGKRVKILVLED